MEKCTNCGRDINDIEKVYVYQGKNVVCGECYALLTNKNYDTPTKKVKNEPEINKDFWKKMKQKPDSWLRSEIKKFDKSKEQFICTSCGYIGCPIIKLFGFLEIILWLFFLPIGLIYTCWEIANPDKCRICPGCKKKGTMIPASTPLGRKLVNQMKEE